MGTQTERRKAVAAGAGSVPWRVAFQIAVIVVAVFISYLPAFRAEFVWDDEMLVTGNPLLQNPSGLVEIWSGSRTADYFPLTNTVFWVEHHLFGQNPAGYHMVNIFLQALNALLVWAVLRQLNVPGAWLAGLIFGIHPVHVESVAWISELKNVLSLFFALLSALCFLKIKEKRLTNAVTAYSASLLLFVLALLSKTQVVFLPVVLLLCAWWSNRSLPQKERVADLRCQATRTLPFFLIAIVLGLVTIWFQNRGIGEEEILMGGFGRRLANAGMAVWWYMGKLFAPVALTPVYRAWRFGPVRPVEWVPAVALAALFAVLWWWRKRGTRGALFALSCFVVALAPVLGFVRMAFVRSGALVADHCQYFADIAPIALFSACVAILWARQRQGIRIALAVVVLPLLGAMGAYTWDRAGVFRNEETLWHDTLAKNPDAWQAHARLGQLFFRQGKYGEAAQEFERMVRLKPELPEHHYLLGQAYCRLRRFKEGIAQYREALQLKEGKSMPADNASVAMIRVDLANALAIAANNLSGSANTFPGGTSGLGGRNGEAMRLYNEAVVQYEKALELEPEQPAVHRNLGLLLAKLGRFKEAVVHLRAALKLQPNEPYARETLEEIEAVTPDQ
jgi:Flp pilus assembly protein TadD